MNQLPPLLPEPNMNRECYTILKRGPGYNQHAVFVGNYNNYIKVIWLNHGVPQYSYFREHELESAESQHCVELIDRLRRPGLVRENAMPVEGGGRRRTRRSTRRRRRRV